MTLQQEYRSAHLNHLADTVMGGVTLAGYTFLYGLGLPTPANLAVSLILGIPALRYGELPLKEVLLRMNRFYIGDEKEHPREHIGSLVVQDMQGLDSLTGKGHTAMLTQCFNREGRITKIAGPEYISELGEKHGQLTMRLEASGYNGYVDFGLSQAKNFVVTPGNRRGPYDWVNLRVIEIDHKRHLLAFNKSSIFHGTGERLEKVTPWGLYERLGND